MIRVLAFVILALHAPAGWAQADDLAAERARLANQRIEAEARAREEAEQQARLAAERDAVSQQSAPPAVVETRNVSADTPVSSAQATPVGASPTVAMSPATDVDRMLEQIRTLGELLDAGYVTEAEFERIKRRILDGAL